MIPALAVEEGDEEDDEEEEVVLVKEVEESPDEDEDEEDKGIWVKYPPMYTWCGAWFSTHVEVIPKGDRVVVETEEGVDVFEVDDDEDDDGEKGGWIAKLAKRTGTDKIVLL